MITSEMAKKEIDTGLSAVCAWCEHYYYAKDNATQYHATECGKKCGGPVRGGSFQNYKGNIPLPTFCFICGRPSEGLIEFPGGRSLGICNTMGPEGLTCFGRFEAMLRSNVAGKKFVVNERVVPILGTKIEAVAVLGNKAEV